MIRFLVDENLRGQFWHAIQAHSLNSEYPLDAICVGNTTELPLGISDSEIMRWIDKNERILVTLDQRTMAPHLNDHLRSGAHVPGIFTLRRDFSHSDILDFLEAVAYASDPQSGGIE